MFFIIIIIIYLIVGLISINYPKVILPISIILMPLERFNLYIGFTLEPLLLYIPIIVLSLYINKDIFQLFKKRVLSKKDNLLYITLIIIILSIFLSDIFSINKFLSLKSTPYVILSFFIFLYAYMYILYYKNKIQIINTFIVSTFIVSIYGILQFFGFLFFKIDSFHISKILHSSTINPTAFTLYIHHILLLRPNSTFTDVNTASGFILLIIPLIISYYLVIKDKTKIIGTLYNYMLPFIIFYFITTFSKSSIIGLLFSVAYIVYVFKIYNKKKFIYTLITSILILLLIEIKYNFLYYLYIKEKFTYIEHFILTKYSFIIFTKHILFGTGIGTFTYYFGTYIKPYIHYYYNNIDTPPLFLLWLSEIGLIGFLSYISFLSVFLRKVLLYIKKEKDVVVISLLAGFIGIIIANLFHSYFTLLFVWEFMGITLAISTI